MYTYISSILDLPPNPPPNSSRSSIALMKHFLCFIAGSHLQSVLPMVAFFYVLIRILGVADLYKYEIPTQPVGIQNLDVCWEVSPQPALEFATCNIKYL